MIVKILNCHYFINSTPMYLAHKISYYSEIKKTRNLCVTLY